MVEEILFYSTKDERKILIDSIQSQGKTILHDDFLDNKGNPTDGKSGRLSFDTITPKIPTQNEIRDEELIVKLKDDSMTLPEVREFLKLRFVDNV